MGRPNEKDVIKPYGGGKPLPSQLRFHGALNDRDDTRFVLYMGGVGCGKTRAAIEQGIHCSLEWPGNIGIVGRLVLTDIKRSIKLDYIQVLEEQGIDFEEIKSEDLILIGNNTIRPSKIIFVNLAESHRLGSMQIGWFHIEEASDLPDDQAFMRLKQRLRFNWSMPPLNKHAIRQRITPRPRRPFKHMGFLTANPPNEDHWLAQYFPEPEMVEGGKFKPVPGHVLIQANSYENKAHLPESFFEPLEIMPESWKRVYLHGHYGFLRTGKPVYSGFNEDLHVSKLDWNRHLPILRAWDFGRSHPCVLWGQLDDNGRLFILREYMGTDIILDDFIPVIVARSNEWFPGAEFRDCCDIAGSQRNDKAERTSIETLRANGIDPSARRCSAEIEGPDIVAVQRLINKLVNGRPALMVDESCKLVIRGLSGGYQVGKDGKKPEEDGYYEHSMDCLKYMVANFMESEPVHATKNLIIPGPRWGW